MSTPFFTFERPIEVLGFAQETRFSERETLQTVESTVDATLAAWNSLKHGTSTLDSEMFKTVYRHMRIVMASSAGAYRQLLSIALVITSPNKNRVAEA